MLKFSQGLLLTSYLPVVLYFDCYTTEIILNQYKSSLTQTKDFVKNRVQFFRELYFRNRDRLFQRVSIK
ncbi:MAG: hypothetical protein MGF17_03895 [Trichodesmium sp. MAG_R04]|nr:hypothetical protein [Trichodesmium sp. MAG_R04]